MGAEGRAHARRLAKRLNAALCRRTGYEFHRVDDRPDDTLPPLDPAVVAATRAANSERKLVRPAFILSSVRSGSTLLRLVLDTHSQLYAPHELHLRSVQVRLANSYAARAMAELGSDELDLQFLLWDRLLHRELVKHGKQQLVNKTPSDALIWERIVQCWPDARFIFLLRDPGAVVESWHRARKSWSRSAIEADVHRYMAAVEDARRRRGGLTVRYEEFTADPERESRRLCEYLGVPFEPAILDYGRGEHGSLRAGLGDWSARIKSGTIQPARAVDDVELGPELQQLARIWEYRS
ncbi:MAG: sulfotransferase family protein [Jatrophihabitans sp.]|uniref:sulfotransferase family protein n=1 Tax=Jatrophihabitans sp. TaxID=1932789 RepID=UPI003F7F29DD